VRGGNPWIFSQAIARVEPTGLAVGDAGKFSILLETGWASAIFNLATTIVVWMLAFDKGIEPANIVLQRVRQALELRHRTISSDTNCYRLINGDGDGLSGVVIDRYRDIVVLRYTRRLITNARISGDDGERRAIRRLPAGAGWI
jgi:23S rRNA (cytosine1962-C5)-methyltransferase